MRIAVQTNPGAWPTAVGHVYTPTMLAEFARQHWPTEKRIVPGKTVRVPAPSIVLSVQHASGNWLPVEPERQRGLWPVLRFSRMTDTEARIAISGARATLRRRDELDEFLGALSGMLDELPWHEFGRER